MKLSGPIDLIKQSFQVFFKKENLIYFVKVFSPLIPFQIFFYYQSSFLKINTSSASLTGITSLLANTGWIFGLIFLVYLGFLLVTFWISASGVKAVANVVSDQKMTVGQVFKFGWGKTWGLFVVGFFSSLLIFSGLIATFVIWVILSLIFPSSTQPTGLYILLIMGSLVSLVLVFVFTVQLTFSRYIYLTQEIGALDSIKKSISFAKGRFWNILGRIFVIGLFQGLVEYSFGLIPFGVGSIVLPVLGGLFILPYFLLYKELSGLQ